MRVPLIVFSTAALTDIEAIGAYIRTDNADRAASFVDELIAACDRLADMPRAFPLVPRYEALNVRRRNLGRYAIFYRFEKDVVEILHILHSAQDYAHILFPEA